MSQTQIQPLGDRVIVEPDSLPDELAPGIFRPASAGEAPNEGTVLAVGPDCTRQWEFWPDTLPRPLPDQRLQLGYRVLFGKYCGTEVQEDGALRLILRESDILAILPPKPAADPNDGR